MTTLATVYSIKHLDEAERPRERLMRHGPEMLSAAELIAILLGSGTQSAPVLQMAQQLVAHFGGLKTLAEATVEELCQVKGIGPAKAIQLRAAFSLGKRLNAINVGFKYKVEHPIHAYHLVKEELSKEKREVFKIILLDVRGYVITAITVSIGTLTEAPVHPREVFYPAIRHKAVSLILVHNHPSGDTTPSKKDFDITRTLVEAGHTIGIPIADHIIVGPAGYRSMREHGEIFGETKLQK